MSRNNPVLRFKKLHETAQIPTYGTDQSACFDFYTCIYPFKTIYFVDEHNEMCEMKLQYDYIPVHPNERFLIPTGICADIPENYCIKLYSRSGISFKAGLMLTNGVGVIDSDYTQEILVSITNISPETLVIPSGERIAQGELAQVIKPKIEEIDYEISQKGNREGGFGSTGST